VKKLIVVLAILVVVLAGAAYYVSKPGTEGAGDEGFTVQDVEYGALTDAVSATGLIQPRDVAAVGSQASGQVLKVYPDAEVEHEITKGQPLIELDKRPAELKLREAKNALKEAQDGVAAAQAAQRSAEQALATAKEHLKVGGFQKEVDAAQAYLDQAKAKVVLAQDQVAKGHLAIDLANYALEQMTIKAPEGGVILEKSVVLGQLIGPPASASLFKLARDLEHLQVHTQVAEGDIARIKNGQLAEFTVYAYSDAKKFEGRVTQIRSMPNNVHGAVYFDTLVDVTNERDDRTGNWKLKPGMTAAVDVVIRRHEGVWKLPLDALNLQLDEHHQTPAARAQVADWPTRHPNAGSDWKPVWVLDRQTRKPWPVFVRIGGTYTNGQYKGQTGIHDGQFTEVLEWDPEMQNPPKPGTASTYPAVITNAPPAHKPGLFDQPGRFKLS
jgi:HlyD family secretion protein